MRKILSVIMVVAMLVTSILPAIANVAAADADTLVVDISSVGFVENEDGTASAKVDLAFTNNPGFVDVSLFVYYNNTEVSEGTDEAADAFADYAAIGAGKRSTLAAVKKYFTAAGVATGANIYGKQIDINCYDPETGDPVLNTTTGTALTLEFIADEFSADMLANIGVFVVDEVAYDADGNEIKTTREDNGFAFRPLGQGRQDFKKILEACEECGTEVVIVEQDQTYELEELEAARISREYLRDTFGL
jgi:hypothetical protein